MKLADVRPGLALPTLTKPPISTRQLVQYAGASGDFNRIHYDEPFAKAGGFPSVIAHGMLSMGFFGELVARWAGAANLLRLGTRFKAVTLPGDVVTVEGVVTEVDAGAHTASIALTAKTQKGVVTLEGTATVRLD
jgi:acyl dehydratase